MNIKQQEKKIFFPYVFVATAHASSYYAMGLMDRDIYRGFPENFGSRSIFLAHDYLTVYKNTSKLIV